MKQVLATLSLVFSLSSFVFFTACGDDSSASVNDDESSSSAKTVILSSSEGSSNSSSSAKSNGSSNSTKKSSSSRMDSILSSDDSRTSSSLQNDKKSSSSMKSPSSSWSGAIGSSNSTPKSSSSVIPDSVPGSASSSSNVTLSATSVESNGSSAASSSSEYVPFDHSKTLAEDWRVGENRYKQFTDPRNGRSYYYIKIVGKNSLKEKDSVTIMAENLNIGEIVLGKDEQSDDSKIERYCYNNDSTLCDEFGGLYQWAEMMQLPSRCNTESCSDLIQENHRGICPEGWRLMTYDDFYIAWHAETNSYGIEGVRSAYSFNGYNSTGLSLTGAGLRMSEGGFESLRETFFWAYPQEHSADANKYVRTGSVSSFDDGAPSSTAGGGKITGRSVRCVKVEQ